MIKWIEEKICKLYEYGSGLSISSNNIGTGYPFLSFSTIFNNYIVPTQLKDFVESTEKDRKNCSIKKGDVFLTRTSETVEELAMSSVAIKDYPEATFNGFTKRLRPITNKISPIYAAYFFRSPYFRKQAIAMSSLITRASLNISMMNHFVIRYPEDFDFQEKIGNILYCYDLQIENNKKRIEILNTIATELYKEWFIRFRFPNHSNSKFNEGIPENWKVKKYIEELNIVYGKGLPTTKLCSDGYPVFGSNGQIGFYSKYMYEEPQILISCRGASSGIVNISLPKSYITSNSLICERDERTESNFEYLEYFFKNTNLAQFQTGSAQPQITINNIKNMKIIIPPIDIQEKFSKIIKPIDDEIYNLTIKNRNLLKQRDLLLPRLMSGKLEVK